ncbi:MAG: type I glyceraldehyde-3-phosphate dehydrogenase [Chlamydiota bacterium]|nr:type I glyceraldehyde-3-phosphate dehydrogenase [Chlamydiota bacterium]
MKLRVGINGMGRIGKALLRQLSTHHPDCEVVAVNDLYDADQLAPLIAYDSIHGPYKMPVTAEGSKTLKVGDRRLSLYCEKEPRHIPWGKHGVQVVLECTGKHRTRALASGHLEGGAEHVILSAPGGEDIPTYVMGVNDHLLDRGEAILSNASCTTNCASPLLKVVHEAFGVEMAMLSTVHAVTASQPLFDQPSSGDPRGGRSAWSNIIPASTGAAQAIARVLPSLKGKIAGMAFRVPVANVSVIDLTLSLLEPTDYEGLCMRIQEAASGPLSGILGVAERGRVSSDFLGDTRSSIFDREAGLALGSHFFKLVAWYDNEMGYAARLIDLMKRIGD